MEAILFLWPALCFSLIGFVVGFASWFFGGLGSAIVMYRIGQLLLFLSLLVGFVSLVGLAVCYVLVGLWLISVPLIIFFVLVIVGLVKLRRRLRH